MEDDGRAKRAHTDRQQTFAITSTVQWTPIKQAEFNQDLCKVFVSAGLPWNVANDPKLGRFAKKWMGGAELPDRRYLAGTVLDREINKYEAEAKAETQRKLATGQSDGWKNISKTSLAATMIVVNGKVSHLSRSDKTLVLTLGQAYPVGIHNTSDQAKTADNHLKLVEEDIERAESEWGVTIIAWCSDAGGDSRAMRVCLCRKCPWLVVPDCMSHQVWLSALVPAHSAELLTAIL